jgi:hypothetical protein
MGSTPKVKPAPPPPSPPTPVDDRMLQARESERRRLVRLRGYRSTILTSPLGVPGQASTRRATLLGG